MKYLFFGLLFLKMISTQGQITTWKTDNPGVLIPA